MSTRTLLALAATGVVATAASAPAQVLFSDNFDTAASAANYNVVVQSANGAAGSGFTPGFAYSNLGVAGDVRSGSGALFETDGAITAFLNPLVFSATGAQDLSIKYDAYYKAVSGGSTENSTLGVGNGANPFELYLSAAQRGTENTNGVFVTASTDSDTNGGGDYVLAESADGTVGVTRLFDGDAAAATQSGTGFATILPAVDGGPGAGVLNGRFASIELIIRGDQVTYNLNGVEVATSTATVPTTGQIGIGLVDPFPSPNNGSVGFGDGTSVIIDNLVVSVAAPVPEPTSLAVLGLGGLAVLGRRRRA